MTYTTGFVAFIDILGFSTFVEEEAHANNVCKLFAFIENIQNFFNKNVELNAKIAFFSDSIVISSKDDRIIPISIAIDMLENCLYQNTELYFRGGITHGKYYHSDGIAFGPAIVKAYQLEGTAKDSRIIIDPQIAEEFSEALCGVFQDFDGQYYLNPYWTNIVWHLTEVDNPTVHHVSCLIKEQRKRISDSIKRNFKTKVTSKYLWRILPFNETCSEIEEILKTYDIEYTQNDIDLFQAEKLTLEMFKDEAQLNTPVFTPVLDSVNCMRDAK